MTPASADDRSIHVIVNPEANVSTLDDKQVMSLFLGRARGFPNGQLAKPFDYDMADAIRADFFEHLTGKQISDIDAYWARLSYSGRAFPPKSLKDREAIIAEVARNKQAISYVRGLDADTLASMGVLVVHSLKGKP